MSQCSSYRLMVSSEKGNGFFVVFLFSHTLTGVARTVVLSGFAYVRALSGSLS